MKVHSILIFVVLLSTAIGAPQWEDLRKRLAEMDKDEIDDISTEDWDDKLKDVLKQEYKELKDELSSDEWDDQKDEVKDTLKKKYKTYKKEIKKQIKEAKKLKSAEESSEESESLENKVKKESRRRKQERRNEKEVEKAKRIKTHTRKGTPQEKVDEEKLIPQTDDTVEQSETQVEQNSPAISHLIQKTNKAFEKFRKFVLETESNNSSGRINSNPLLAYIANKKLHSGSHAHSRRPILPPIFEYPFRRPASEANESVGLPVPSTVSGGEIGIGSGTAENGAASLSKINEAASIIPESQSSGTDVKGVSAGSSDVSNIVSSSGSSIASAGGDSISSGTSSEHIIQGSVSHHIDGSASTGQTDLSTSSGTGGTLPSSPNVSSTSGISASGDTGSDISFGSSTGSVASSQVNASTIDPSLSVISPVISPIASILPALPGLNVGAISGNAAIAESSSDSVGTANVDASSSDSSPPASGTVIPSISSNLPVSSGSSVNVNPGSAVVIEHSIDSGKNSHSDANAPSPSPSVSGDRTSPIFTILPFPLPPNLGTNSGNAAVAESSTGSVATSNADANTSDPSPPTSGAVILPISSNLPASSESNLNANPGSGVVDGPSIDSGKNSHSDANAPSPSSSVSDDKTSPIFTILPFPFPSNVGAISGNAAVAESSTGSVSTSNADANTPDSSPPTSGAVILPISSNLPTSSGSNVNANPGSAVVDGPSIDSGKNSHSDVNAPSLSSSVSDDKTSPIFTILPFPFPSNVDANSGNSAVAESSTGSVSTSNADANTPDSSPPTSGAVILPISSDLPTSSGSNVNANPGSVVVDGPFIDSGKNSHSDANAPSPSSSVSDDKTSPIFTILPFPFPSNVGAISGNAAIAGSSNGSDANIDVNTPDSSSSINTAVMPPSDGTLPDAPESSGDIISESAVISGSSSVDITTGPSSEPESVASVVIGNTKPSEPAIDPIATSESGVSVSSGHANVAASDNTIAADDTLISESPSVSEPAEGVHIGVITPSEPATDPNTISESGVSASSNQLDASASDTIETDLNGSSTSSSKSNTVTSGSKPDSTGTSNSNLNSSSLIDTLVSGPESSVSADHSGATSSGSSTDSGSGSGPVSEIESGAEPALEIDVEKIHESTVNETLILPNIPPSAVESDIQSDSPQASTPHLLIPDTPSLPNTNSDSTVGESSSPVDILPSNASLDLPVKDIPSSDLEAGVSPIEGYLPWQKPLTDSESGTTIEVTSSEPVSAPETTSASSDPSVPTDASPPNNGTDASSTDASDYTTTESTIDKSTTDGSNHTITEPTTDKSTTDGSDSTTIESTTDESDYTTTESTIDKSTTDGSNHTITEPTTDKSTTDGSDSTITEPTTDESTTDESDSTTIEPTTDESTTHANDIANNSTIIIGEPNSPDSSPNENSPTTGSENPLGGIDTWIPYSFPQRYKRQGRFPLRARRFYLI